MKIGYYVKHRIKNKELIEEVKKQTCVICKRKHVDAHHIKTKGAGGDDTEDNLVPLCRKHHIEIHAKGILTTINKYPNIYVWLIEHNRDDILIKFSLIK